MSKLMDVSHFWDGEPISGGVLLQDVWISSTQSSDHDDFKGAEGAIVKKESYLKSEFGEGLIEDKENREESLALGLQDSLMSLEEGGGDFNILENAGIFLEDEVEQCIKEQEEEDKAGIRKMETKQGGKGLEACNPDLFSYPWPFTKCKIVWSNDKKRKFLGWTSQGQDGDKEYVFHDSLDLDQLPIDEVVEENHEKWQTVKKKKSKGVEKSEVEGRSCPALDMAEDVEAMESSVDLSPPVLDKELDSRQSDDDDCASVASTASSLFVQYKTVEDLPFKCLRCAKPFGTEIELKIHARIHTGERPFKCKQCGDAFVRESYLKEHQKTVHMEDEMDLSLDEERPIGLKSTGTSTGAAALAKDGPFFCPYCDISFDGATELRTHLEANHQEECDAEDQTLKADNTKRGKHATKVELLKLKSIQPKGGIVKKKRRGISFTPKKCGKTRKITYSKKIAVAPTEKVQQVVRVPAKKQFKCLGCSEMSEIFDSLSEIRNHLKLIHNIKPDTPGEKALVKEIRSDHQGCKDESIPVRIIKNPGNLVPCFVKLTRCDYLLRTNPSHSDPPMVVKKSATSEKNNAVSQRQRSKSSKKKPRHQRLAHTKQRRLHTCEKCGTRFTLKSEFLKHVMVCRSKKDKRQATPPKPRPIAGIKVNKTRRKIACGRARSDFDNTHVVPVPATSQRNDKVSTSASPPANISNNQLFKPSHVLALVTSPNSEESFAETTTDSCSSYSTLPLGEDQLNSARPSPCEFCDKIFEDQSALRQHKLFHRPIRHDSLGSPNPLTCQFCGKLLKNPSALRQHEAFHLPVRPFTCNFLECTKAYKTKFELNRHLLTHSGELKYVCSVCEGSFLLKTRLKHHILNCHKGCVIDIFPPEPLVASENNDTHFASQLGPVLWKCRVCQKLFVSLEDVKRHVRNRHKQRANKREL